MEEINCRFPSCKWTGDINDLFGHCETYHANFIKEISDDNGFTFTFDDMAKNTFLLNGKAGLYWFLLDPNEDEGSIRRGVFAIGESEICDYTAKIGSINDGYVTYLGPLKTQPVTSDKYEIEFSYLHFDLLQGTTAKKCIEVYFGEYKDNEEYTGTYEDVDWEDPEEEKYNQWCLEKFTCFVCFEFIRSNARFCENRHFLCSECLTKLMEANKLKCPMCRGDFPYDCVDQEIEELLRCVRFPEAESEAGTSKAA